MKINTHINTLKNSKIFSISKLKPETPHSQQSSNKRSQTPLHKHTCSPNDTPIRLRKPPGPSFEFTSTPRFKKFFIPLTKRKLSKDQVSEINKRIKKNKIFSIISPTERAKLCKSAADRHRTREQITKIARNCIWTLKKQKLETEIEEKNRKSNLRQRSKEIYWLARNWIGVILVCGLNFSMKKLVENRTKLKSRNHKRMSLIRNIFRAIGKFKIILRKIRANKSLAILSFRFLPLFRSWKKGKSNIHQKKLSLYLSDTVSYTWLYKLVCLMDHKCRFIQKTLRICVSHKAKIYKQLVSAWDEFEKILQKKRKKPDNESFQSGRLMVPGDVKLMIIKKFIRDKYKGYYKVLCEYFKKCKEVDELNEEYRWRVDCVGMKAKYPVRPNFPLFLHVFKIEDFGDMRKSAVGNRSYWEHLLELEKIKVMKSY